jgi:mannose-6-phosphate isomerase-like protein (cupin superfamily)
MIVNQSNAEHYTWGRICDGWRLLDGSDVSVIQERIPPGGGEILHVHHRARQLFFVLAGALDIDIEGTGHSLRTGDALEIVPGRRHRVCNTSDADVSFLVISVPSTRDDRENLAP